MKKIISTCIALMVSAACSISAFAMEVPTNTTIQDLNGVRQYIKIYTVAPDTDPQSLIDDVFEYDGYTYTYSSMTKEEQSYSEKEHHTETVTADTEKSDLSVVLKALSPSIEYDDGEFRGTLYLDHSTISTVASGYTTKSYTVSTTKEIDNLDTNDMAYVPDTTTKNGVTVQLQSVDWQVQGTSLVDDILVPAQYKAVATYAGRASYRAATGYATTAKYIGDIVAEGIESVTYTVTYTGTPSSILQRVAAKSTENFPIILIFLVVIVLAITSEAAILHDAGEDGNSVSDMVPREISELHDEAEEAAEYSVDLSEEPETVSPESTPISSTEESDWGFQEPKKEITEEKGLEPPLEAPVPAGRSKIAPKSDRQLFYELKFNNLDRGLPPEERQEWNSIYASYRGRSAITGTIIGVDPHSIYVWNPETERREKKTMYCAIVVPYRVRIVIPASEMWESGNERPDYVLQNMVGASIDLVIIKVEREAGFAIGSRRLASRSQRYFFAHREDLHRIGSRVKCRMLAVGPRRCLVDCYGHDLDLTQREMRYAAIPDLRDEYHPGMELESVVKVYDSTKDELIISVKETETNPILGAEQRHPVGSRRLAVISGKYGGGVFCNLPDGVVCMCNYSFQHEDSDFMVGENVMLVVQRYNEEKLQMFGKILSKW